MLKSNAWERHMIIKYEIEFDEPLVIDGDWPLSLPGGGRFNVVQENGKATAFAVEFSGKPSDIFSVVDGTNHLNDLRWSEIRRFYARLKSHLQCVTEIDFDPTEVYAHYIGETKDEKKQIPMHKVVVTKGRRGRLPMFLIMRLWLRQFLVATKMMVPLLISLGS